MARPPPTVALRGRPRASPGQRWPCVPAPARDRTRRAAEREAGRVWATRGCVPRHHLPRRRAPRLSAPRRGRRRPTCQVIRALWGWPVEGGRPTTGPSLPPFAHHTGTSQPLGLPPYVRTLPGRLRRGGSGGRDGVGRWVTQWRRAPGRPSPPCLGAVSRLAAATRHLRVPTSQPARA